MGDIRTINAVNAVDAIAENPPIAVGLVHTMLSGLSKAEVMATLCTVMDSFFGDWEMSEEECVKTWRHLADTAEMAYELMGVMPSSRKAGDN